METASDAATSPARSNTLKLHYSVHGFLAGIKFDDGLLVGDGLNFIAARDAHYDSLKSVFIEREPIRHGAAGGNFKILAGQLARGIGILYLDDVVHFQAKRRNVDFAAIDPHVAMRNQLTRPGASIGKTELVADVVEASFQNL